MADSKVPDEWLISNYTTGKSNFVQNCKKQIDKSKAVHGLYMLEILQDK